MLGRGARWTAWVVLGGWSLGLVVGSVILHQQTDAMHRVLVKFKQDNAQQALSQRNGERLSTEAQNNRVLALLAVMDQMDNKRLWSVFMPGSWPWVDRLPSDVRDYLETAFGDIAAATLQRALQAKISQLTGVPQDPSTGELIQGSTCTPLTSAINENAKVNNPMGFQELPEFAALLSYVTAVEQIDMAYGAMQRLQTPGLAPNPNDLQLLVKLVTGTDLVSVSQRSSELFRSKAASAYRMRLAPVQEAMRCGFGQRALRLQDMAFNNNVLLTSQRNLTASINSLTETVEDNGDANEQLDTLTSLLSEIKAHETLLLSGSGSGAWMKRPSFQPGATWDSLLARTTSTQMLGVPLAQLIKDRFESAYKGFSIELSEQLTENPTSEVVWDEKEMRFVPGPGLSNLRSGLHALMAEPYMSTVNSLPAPDLSSHPATSQGLNWDLARLDEALATQEQRKKFKGDLLQRFPANSQRAIDQIVKSRLANQIMHHVHAALMPNSRLSETGNDMAGTDTERTRLNRLQLLLSDLGARRESDAIRALVTRDALRRLQVLDAALMRAELYTAKGRSFNFWQGEKGPVLGAFGLPDLAALQPYLAQQVARLEELSKEADAILSQLNPSGASSMQAQRWQNISRDLERFKLKNPNSSLMALEGFLTVMAGEVDGQNCMERLAGKVPGGRPGDFFAERHLQLGASLSQRCNELRLKEQLAQWAVFAQDFNRTLAGRPPFATPGWSAEAPMVEIDEIVPLLRNYDKARGALHALQQNQRGSASSMAMQRFMVQFDRTRSFLAPLAPTEDTTPVGYDVAVEFRANQSAEIQGNKVIDWTLEIGRQRLSLRDVPKPLRWEPGQAVTLTLRLAKDGQVMPLADAKQPAMSVDGKTVTLRYADAWSLFNLIGRQREGEARNDGRSQLLRLEFPLQLDTLPTMGAAPFTRSGAATLARPAETNDNRARVYLRLTLSPPGKRTPLMWPGALPTRAPDPLNP
jgi:type VI secretion system protein ImpL